MLMWLDNVENVKAQLDSLYVDIPKDIDESQQVELKTNVKTAAYRLEKILEEHGR